VKFIAVWLLAAGLVIAQNTNQGAIAGTVSDPSGAILPEATLQIRNTSNGLGRTASAKSGNYRLDALPPGPYEITAEAPGFRKSIVKAIRLEVGQVLRVDVRLELGQTSESVTVTAAAAPMNTESPAMGEVLETEVVQQMPLNGREFLELGALLPGAESGNVKRGIIDSKGVAVGFGGARAQHNAYFVDGADSTDANANQLISSPSVDAIREFRIETSMYSAQYGRSGGAVVSVVTKSGSNALHGTLYEYHRNRALDAMPRFYTGARRDSPRYLFNQFGATLGGPLRRNKSFYFASYEGFREVRPGQQVVTFSPTARERAGDLSQTINPYSNRPVVLRNPFDGTLIPGNIIPATLQSKAGRNIMALWPEPNSFGSDPFLNYRVFRGGRGDRTKYLARIDHLLSARDTLSGTFNFGEFNTITPGMEPSGDTNTLEHDKTMVLSWTRVLSPRIVNDVKFSHTWYDAGSQLALQDKNYATEWGIWNQSEANGAPRLLLYTAGGRTFYFGGPAANIRYNRNLYLKNLLSIHAGGHTLSIGGDFKHQNYDWNFSAAGNGGTFWLGLNDGGSLQIAGSTFADVLMGTPTQIAYNLNDGKPSLLRRSMIGAFLQDDWNVSRRLTVNLGIRYDFESPFEEARGRLATFNFDTAKVRYAAGAPQDLLDKLTYSFERNGPSQAYNANALNLAPRAGFAWRPFRNGKSVVRGGYGLFYTSESAYSTAYSTWVTPFAGTYTYNARAAFIREPRDRYVPFDNKPYKVDELRFGGPASMFVNSPYYPQGYMQQWNFTLARQIGNELVFETAYVGSKGVNLSGVGSLPVANAAAALKVQSGSGVSPTVRLKGFNTKYHSWQTKLVKRYSRGMHLIAAFTWSHAMTESSNEQTVENIFTDADAVGNFVERRYANADTDVRKRFTLTAGYKIPFGSGRRHGQGAPRLLTAMFGNWDLQAILTLSDGVPFTVYSSNLRFPDRVCDGNLPAAERTPQRWFDTRCFVSRVPVSLTRPDGSRVQTFVNGNSGPNIITGPGIVNADLGVHKEVRFTESRYAQLRFEGFNFINRTNYAAPAANYFLNTPTGGEITRAREMRRIQLALKIVF
jgi:hypothetical protein